MGEVYKATSCLDRWPYAVKVLKAKHGRGSSVHIRFKHEFCVLRRVSHPHIVGAHAYQETEDECFYSMDLLEGPTLSKLIGPDEPPLSVARVLRLGMQLCDAIRHLHVRGVVHRDLKPDNIIVEQKAGRDHAWLVDFGVCKLLPAWYADLEQRTEPGLRLQTESGAFLGTPGYAAAGGDGEQEDDELRDVFGLAATLFICLTKRLPYRQAPPKPGSKVEWFSKDDRLPGPLKSALEFALALDPAARCPSIEMFEGRLRVVLEDLEADDADEVDADADEGDESDVADDVGVPAVDRDEGIDSSGTSKPIQRDPARRQAAAPVLLTWAAPLVAGACLVLLGWSLGAQQTQEFSPSRTAIAWASGLPSYGARMPDPVHGLAPSADAQTPPADPQAPPADAQESDEEDTEPVVPSSSAASARPHRDPVRTSRRDELSAARGDLGRCLPLAEGAPIEGAEAEIAIGADGTVREVSVKVPNLPSMTTRCMERRLEQIVFRAGKTTTHRLKL